MIRCNYVGDVATARRFGLKMEGRRGWKRRELQGITRFVHKSNLPPETVKQFGISPLYAKDHFVDENDNQIRSGKMVFAFPEGNSGKAIYFFFGSCKYTYGFQAGKGRVFYCSGGQLGVEKEVAFPYIIEWEDIVSG